jgi:hypothetical protein
MAKPGKKRKHPNTIRCVNATIAPERNTLSSLREDEDMWYKVRVLIYDLRNMDKDHASEQRTLCTTDELYISAPYFTPAEASRIKKAIVERTARSSSLSAVEEQPTGHVSISSAPIEPVHACGTETIEDEIKTRLEGFFEKRRASGDSRPCGPHDLAPIYMAVFGVEQAEIKDERFLSRLRRSGLAC